MALHFLLLRFLSFSPYFQRLERLTTTVRRISGSGEEEAMDVSILRP